jgi:hypothetical protein
MPRSQFRFRILNSTRFLLLARMALRMIFPKILLCLAKPVNQQWNQCFSWSTCLSKRVRQRNIEQRSLVITGRDNKFMNPRRCGNHCVIEKMVRFPYMIRAHSRKQFASIGNICAEPATCSSQDSIS